MRYDSHLHVMGKHAQMGNEKQNKMLREIFLGFVRVHLLHHAAHERIYGLEMMEELRRHGYEIGPGTLYPMLHNLEKDGYLKSEQELVEGKLRKYYRATAAGRKTLAQLKEKIRELVHEVLEN